VDAAKALQGEGIHAAVVSMPCAELFAAQSDSYRAEVLGSAPRVAVEAAAEFGWERWIGPEGRFVGMRGFGASAPAQHLYKHFGITADAVAEAARELTAKTKR
jgi:transketolase